MRISDQGVSRSFMAILHSEFWNSKWWIQNGGPPKCKNLLDWDKNWYSRVIEDADYESTQNLNNKNNESNTTGQYVKICFILVKIGILQSSI